MDGFGLNPLPYGNAIAAAGTPYVKSLVEKYPHASLGASGLDVGLPEGQMGNSEVGHLNIGAGRIVYQDFTRISKAIKDGDFFENKAFLKAIANAKDNGKKLHIMGLTGRAASTATSSIFSRFLSSPRCKTFPTCSSIALWTDATCRRLAEKAISPKSRNT